MPLSISWSKFQLCFGIFLLQSVGHALLALFRESDDLLDPVRCDVNRDAVDRLLQTRCANSKPEKILSSSFTAQTELLFIRTREYCGRMIRLFARPSPPLPVSKLSLFLGRPLCRPSSLLTGERGWRGWARSQSYDREKSWPSINYSIVTDPDWLWIQPEKAF